MKLEQIGPLSTTAILGGRLYQSATGSQYRYLLKVLKCGVFLKFSCLSVMVLQKFVCLRNGNSCKSIVWFYSLGCNNVRIYV